MEIVRGSKFYTYIHRERDTHARAHAHTHTHTEAHFISLVLLQKYGNKAHKKRKEKYSIFRAKERETSYRLRNMETSPVHRLILGHSIIEALTWKR